MAVSRRRTVAVHEFFPVALGQVLIAFHATAFLAISWTRQRIHLETVGVGDPALFLLLLALAATCTTTLLPLWPGRWAAQRTLWAAFVLQLPGLVLGAFGILQDDVVLAVLGIVLLGALLGAARSATDELLERLCHLHEANYLDGQFRAASWLAVGLGALFGARLAAGEPHAGLLWLLLVASGVALSALFVPDVPPGEVPRGQRKRRRGFPADEESRRAWWFWAGAAFLWGFLAGALTLRALRGRTADGPGDDVVLLAIVLIGAAFGHLGALLASRGRLEAGHVVAGLTVALVGILAALATELGVLERGLEWLSQGLRLLPEGIETSVPALAGSLCWFLVGAGAGALATSPTGLVRQWAVPGSDGIFAALCRLAAGVGALGGVGVAFLLDPLALDAGLVLLLLAALGISWWSCPGAVTEVRLRLHLNTRRLLRVLDPERVPDAGPALLLTNHLQWLDALLVVLGTPRQLRLILPDTVLKQPGSAALRRLARPLVLPVSCSEPGRWAAALQELKHSLEKGELLCLLNEGHFDDTGPVRGRVRRLFWRLIARHCPTVIPVAVLRGWGPVLESSPAGFRPTRPLRTGQPVQVAFGEPLAGTDPWWRMRQAVHLHTAEVLIRERNHEKSLPWYFLRATRRFAANLCMADSTGVALTYREVLLRLVVLARILRRQLGSGDEMVGVVLPPSVGGTLMNLALILIGKIPVNLNFTASAESLASAAAQCSMRVILASRTLLERVRVTLPLEPLLVEDLRQSVRRSDKLLAALAAYGLPLWVVERFLFRTPRRRPDDTLTVIFSSGSTGDPKGVVLTHHNILSNCQACIELIGPQASDRLIGVLPLFHSFGFLANLWVPFLVGAAAIYHVSPLEPRPIAELTAKYGGTILVSTPTFLRSYMRRIQPEEFRTLRLVITGAEKLPRSIVEAFAERFGLEPLEGYGCTELSPVAACNSYLLFGADGSPVGPKPGSVGHPLPGVAAEVRDVETDEPLPPGQEGMLYIKGPNVMKGYLKRPRLTRQVIQNGWYMTGDVARVDEDGFLVITDRLARFSKIAGEMVPHVRVEEAIREALAGQDVGVAVVGVPDATKGEKLVVLHEPLPIETSELYERLKNCGLPNLWIPARDAFFEVRELPTLPTGKLDLRRAKQLGLELASARSHGDHGVSVERRGRVGN
jgi:acyl-[acyl-carrier-protein]-phospholipid O-acyltransferase/long-chain-fatty-acid--[acyl-carrier-protein] ligase